MSLSKYHWLLPAIIISSIMGCSKVKFAQDEKNSSNDTITNPTDLNSVQCAISLNSGATSASVSASTQNPTVKASCNPADVTYQWNVTKSGAAVTINGLSGASSVGDFYGSGQGTYLVNLTSSKTGLKSYNSSSPLTVTVTGLNNLPQITCTESINGNLKTLTLTYGGNNPTIAANCNPGNVSYVWTVTSGGQTISVPTLTGSSSTPNFLSLNPGTYTISLNATASGYQAYTSQTPLTVTVPARPTRTVKTSKVVKASDNQLDILLVVDDSNSMLKDNLRLADRLQGFVNDLTTAGFDWQMCATLTRAQKVSTTDNTYYWGASRYWIGNSNSVPYILKPSNQDTMKIFRDTITQIGAGWAGTDDERAIKAAWWHVWNGDPSYSGASGCYRKDAGLSVIILSDEDERSVGGDASQKYYTDELKPLESDDQPSTFVNHVKNIFGNAKRFAVNSIIVRPGDAACMQAQDAEGAKSHYGVKYAELSGLTGGHTGSICESDYSSNLKYFKDKIVSSMSSIPLECTPLNDVQVSITPTMAFSSRVENNNLIFSPAIPAGKTINIEYQCPTN